jgi:hypothetical protein
MTRDQIGHLYEEQGGVLGRRSLGSTIWMAQQIKQGGYANPTAEQTAWSVAVIAAADCKQFANAALKHAIVNNTDLQTKGNDCTDGDLDYMVAESAKTYAP